MKRRTFVSSVLAVVCLPFPMFRKRCPYRIEVIRHKQQLLLNAFYEGDECVGYYHPNTKDFSVYVSPELMPDQFTETIAEITSYDLKLHSEYEEKIGTCFVWKHDGVFPKAWCFPKIRALGPMSIIVTIPRELTPEEVAWKMHALRQIC